MKVKVSRFYCHLFRWSKHWQVDMHLPGIRGWFCLGCNWRKSWPRLIAYWSSDATPVNAKGWGWFIEEGLENLKMNERNFAFPSSGDPDEDERIAQQFELHDSRMALNICPNGCGQMKFLSLNERECPVCHFHGWQNSPIKMPEEKVQ